MANYRGFTWLLLICLVNASMADDTVSKRGGEDAAVSASVGAVKGIYKGFLTSCSITVVNESKYKLRNYLGMIFRGDLQSPVEDIQPQGTATVIPISGKWTFLMGTSGIASWQIENKNTRLVVMWRLKVIKWNTEDKNTLWVALTPSKSFKLEDWKKFVVSNAEVPDELNCKKGIFAQNMKMERIVSETKEFKATGIMGTGKNPTATITLSQKKSWFQG